MIENFKRNKIFFLFILLVVFSCKMNAQYNENDTAFNWDGINDLDNVNVGGGSGSDDTWDHASDYWNTEPNDYGSNYDDYYEPYDWRDNNNNHNDSDNNQDTGREPNKQTESKIVLTKTVLPGETHVQEVKVIRDPETSAEKKVIDLTVNGEKVGTITFSDPIIDVNGVDIYSKMTIEVFPECPIAITTITFDSPETTRYDDTKDSTNGNLENAIVNLSLYKDYGIIDFTSPINERENIVITGSTDAIPSYLKIKKDPCAVAKELTALAANQTYQKATIDIKNAAVDKHEHSITLGKTNGQITAAPMEDGEPGEVNVNFSWLGAFTVLHNHPNNTPPSGGDIYAITRLNKNNSNFYSCFAIVGDEIYAISITDLAAAQEFSAKYFVNRAPGDDGEYPKFMWEEMANVYSNMDSYSTEGQTKAKAFVVNKYNGGVTFYKQNKSGEFYPLITKENKQNNGNRTFTLIPCI